MNESEIRDAVQTAILTENVQVVADLLDQRAFDAKACVHSRLTPLMFALTEHSFKVAKFFVEKFDIDVINSGDYYGITPLMQSIVEDCNEITKMLIEKGVNLDTVDAEGRTALFMAIVHNQYEIVKLLIEKGANINSMLDMYATQVNGVHVYLEYEYGEDIEEIAPLAIAIDLGRNEIVKLLISHGVQPITIYDFYSQEDKTILNLLQDAHDKDWSKIARYNNDDQNLAISHILCNHKLNTSITKEITNLISESNLVLSDVNKISLTLELVQDLNTLVTQQQFNIDDEHITQNLRLLDQVFTISQSATKLSAAELEMLYNPVKAHYPDLAKKIAIHLMEVEFIYNDLIEFAKLYDYKKASYYLEQAAEYPQALSDDSEQNITAVNNMIALKEINAKFLEYYGAQNLDQKTSALDFIDKYTSCGSNVAEVEMLKQSLRELVNTASDLELMTQHVEPLGLT